MSVMKDRMQTLMIMKSMETMKMRIIMGGNETKKIMKMTLLAIKIQAPTMVMLRMRPMKMKTMRRKLKVEINRLDTMMNKNITAVTKVQIQTQIATIWVHCPTQRVYKVTHNRLFSSRNNRVVSSTRKVSNARE